MNKVENQSLSQDFVNRANNVSVKHIDTFKKSFAFIEYIDSNFPVIGSCLKQMLSFLLYIPVSNTYIQSWVTLKPKER